MEVFSFMNYLNNFLSGSAIGVANVIPGLSGGSIAVITNKYQRLINVISSFLPNIKNKNTKALKSDMLFLIPLLLGVVTGVLIFAILIEYLLNAFPIATLFSFMGLLIGTIPLMFQNANIKGNPTTSMLVPFFVTLGFSLILAYFNITGDFTANQVPYYELNFGNIILLFTFGFLAAGTMIVPGISGSLVLLILGGYNAIIGAISGLINGNFMDSFLTLIPFGIGCVLGLIVISTLINWLLEAHYTATYYGILGFLIGSIPCLYGGFTANLEGYIAIALLVAFAVSSYLVTMKTKHL